MSASTWLIIAIVGFSVSGIALITSIVLFIILRIPAVIGDLTGRTSARETKAWREANAASGDKLHKPSAVNVERGKLTEKVQETQMSGGAKALVHKSKRLDKTGSARLHSRKKQDEVSEELTKNEEKQTTETLSSNVSEIDIEKQRKTDILVQEGTAVLDEAVAIEINESARTGTTVLNETELFVEESGLEDFKLTKSIVITHTDEVI